MLKEFLFGEWAPDLAPNGVDRLSVCENVFPIANGYAPVPAFSSITPALDEAFKGGGSFIGSDGTSSLIAGTATDLYSYGAGAWTSVLDSLTAGRWYFAQFGDNVIGANGGDLIAYDLLAGTAAAVADAPTAADVATVRDFVVILEPDGDELSVQWSGFNDYTEWGDGVSQSGSQQLLSGGKGVKIVGGEYGTIFQANAITRMTQADETIVWQFDKISEDIGCMARGSVAKVGNMIFFLSERGFMVLTADGTINPIGFEKVDRTFFATYSRDDIQNISAAIDPRRHVVLWAMPGVPGKLWCFNWQLQRWAVIEVSLAGVFSGFTSNVSLDALDALFDDDVDSIPYSLDDPRFAGGNPLLLIANSASVIGTLAGDSLTATLRLPNLEPVKSLRTRLRTIRPVTDATEVSASLNSRARTGDAEGITSSATMRNNGMMPVRANGRFHTIETVVAGDWSYIQGFELEFEPAGLR